MKECLFVTWQVSFVAELLPTCITCYMGCTSMLCESCSLYFCLSLNVNSHSWQLYLADFVCFMDMCDWRVDLDLCIFLHTSHNILCILIHPFEDYPVHGRIHLLVLTFPFVYKELINLFVSHFSFIEYKQYVFCISLQMYRNNYL